MLEVLSFQYTQLPAPVLTLIAYLFTVAGGLLAALFLPAGDGTLNRSSYFLWLGVGMFALAINQLWWLLYVPALKTGWSGLLLVSDLAGSLVYGGFVLRLAMARSRDAYGHARRAYLAFIPFANFVLLFKAGQNPVVRHGVQGTISAAIVVMVLSRIVTSTLTDEVTRRAEDAAADPQIVAVTKSMQLRARGIEAGLDELIAAEGAPARIDSDLMLQAVTRQGLHLTYDFILDAPEAEALSDDYRQAVHVGFCDGLMPYLNLGATATLNYLRNDGADVESLELSLAGCTA
jgi:hypothetical protein